MAEPTADQMLRGLYALAPFRVAFDLPVNPKDMEEIVYAVLKHAAETGPLEQITQAVEAQIVEATAARMALLDSDTDTWPKPTDDPA